MKRKTLSQTLIDAAKDVGLGKATVDKLEALGIPEVKKMTSKEIKALREKLG